MKTLVGLLVAAACAVGCSSNSNGAAAVAKFAGSWHPSSGTITIICPQTAVPEIAPDDLTWKAGASSDLVRTGATTGCVLAANISGTTATAVTGTTATALPGQTCTETSGGATYVITFSTYTYAIDADGQTATEGASGSAVVSNDGATQTCSYSESASYMKVSG